MKERTRNLVVGITALIGIAGALALLMMFAKLPAFQERGYAVHAVMPTAAGLTEGSRVRMNGLDVGHVKKVSLRNPPTEGVDLEATIRKDVQIPEGAVARAAAPLLGGTPTLDIDLSGVPPGQTKMLAMDDTATIKGDAPSNMFASMMEPARKLSQIADNFDALSREFIVLSKEWTLVGKNIQELTEARPLNDVDAGKTLANLSTLLQRGDQRLAELRKTIDGLNSFINDPDLRENIKKTAVNSVAFTQKLGTSADKVNDLMDKTNEQLATLTKRYVAVADDLSGTIAKLNATIEAAKSGDGTVGKLIKDPALYNNLNDAAERLNKALTEVQLFMEKLRKEGIPLKM